MGDAWWAIIFGVNVGAAVVNYSRGDYFWAALGVGVVVAFLFLKLAEKTNGRG